MMEQNSQMADERNSQSEIILDAHPADNDDSDTEISAGKEFQRNLILK